MQRFIVILICTVMSILGIFPMDRAEAEHKGKIVFVPHDDRPTSGSISAEAVEMLGYDVVMPEEDMLGGLEKQGKPEELADWTKANVKDSAALVISSDAIIYGGLVASRRHNLSAEELQKRVDTFADLKKNNPSLNIYVFSSLMRTPKDAAAAGTEEPAYYQQYGAEIFKSSALMDKAEICGLNQKEDIELTTLKEKIPAEIWQDWYGRRAKNLTVNKTLMDMTKDGIIDYFIIGKDDNAPLSATHKESRYLEEYAADLPKTKFQLLAGIDEFAMLLLSRAVVNQENFQPKLYVQYNIGKGAETEPAFSDESIGTSIDNEIIIANGKSVTNPSDADFVLLVNTDPLGRTGNGNSRADMPAYTDKIRAGTIEFADLVGDMLSKNYKVAVADIAFANGADNALMKVMQERGYLLKLHAYAGWNTPTNSSGFVIGQGILATKLNRDKCKRLLVERYLDDWIYQSNVRAELMKMIYRDYNGQISYTDFGSYEDELAMRTQTMMRDLAGKNLGEYRKVNDLRFYFPWHITFIGGIELPK